MQWGNEILESKAKGKQLFENFKKPPLEIQRYIIIIHNSIQISKANGILSSQIIFSQQNITKYNVKPP
jgi:hypothetical protein